MLGFQKYLALLMSGTKHVYMIMQNKKYYARSLRVATRATRLLYVSKFRIYHLF